MCLRSLQAYVIMAHLWLQLDVARTLLICLHRRNPLICSHSLQAYVIMAHLWDQLDVAFRSERKSAFDTMLALLSRLCGCLPLRVVSDQITDGRHPLEVLLSALAVTLDAPARPPVQSMRNLWHLSLIHI